MKNYILITFALMFSLLSFSQEEYEAKAIDVEEKGDVHLRKMKEGVLVVRLFYREEALKTFEKAGKTKVAEKHRKRINKQNLEIIQAYKKYFTFCPVYFINAKDSKYIIGRDFDKFSFLNLQGEENSDITINSKYIYTSDISNVRSEKFNKTSAISFDAVYFRTDRFICLASPFPYFTKTYSSIPFLKRSFNAAVRKANSKIEHAYKFYINKD